MQAVGLSSLLPSSLVWGESHMLMSGQVMALVCWGLSLAELVARPDLFAILMSSSSSPIPSSASSSSGLGVGLMGGGETFSHKESRLLAFGVFGAASMCSGTIG